MLNVLSGKPSWESDPAKTEAYYLNSVRDPAVREYQQTTMPMINESYAGPGYWSSGRAKAVNSANENLSNTLTKAHSDLLYADEQARRDALEKAAGRMATLAPEAAKIDYQQLGEAGQYSRMIDQEKIASQMARWLSGEEINGSSVPAYNPNNQLALALLGIKPFVYNNETTTVKPGMFSNMFGGLGGNIGGMMGKSEE
jgi:hypothetical protein